MTATENFRNFDFDGNQRYTFDRGSETSTTVSYIMKISSKQITNCYLKMCTKTCWNNKTINT